MLIAGASDGQVVPPEEQRQWAATNGAAGGSFTYLDSPEAGHMLPVEAPVELARTLVDWLRRLSG